MDIPDEVPSNREAKSKPRHWGTWIILALIALGVAVWLFYIKVGSKPAGVQPDSSAVIDTMPEPKSGNKEG